jgi:hypothetical protein
MIGDRPSLPVTNGLKVFSSEAKATVADFSLSQYINARKSEDPNG